jgi:hypothetical protein
LTIRTDMVQFLCCVGMVLPCLAFYVRILHPGSVGGKRPPGSPSNSSKIFPSKTVTFSPTPRPHNPFSCNTYESPRKCCKQKSYGMANSFRCNTYRKHGGGGHASRRFNIPPFSCAVCAPFAARFSYRDIPNVSAGRFFDLSPFFSSSSALFCPPGALQSFYNQFVPHSFHRNGGVPHPLPSVTGHPSRIAGHVFRFRPSTSVPRRIEPILYPESYCSLAPSRIHSLFD